MQMRSMPTRRFKPSLWSTLAAAAGVTATVALGFFVGLAAGIINVYRVMQLASRASTAPRRARDRREAP